MLNAPPLASQDWTQAARDAFQHVDTILSENSQSLHSAIKNIDTFAGALARIPTKSTAFLPELERMTGGGTSQAEIPTYDLVAATGFPPPPQQPPAWLLVVPEPDHADGLQHRQDPASAGERRERAARQCALERQPPGPAPGEGDPELRECRLRKEVSRTREGVTGNYQLLLDIRRFHVATCGDAQADIDFVAKLLDQDGKILAAHEFGGPRPPREAMRKPMSTRSNRPRQVADRD